MIGGSSLVVLVGKRPGHLPLNGSAPWAAGMGSPAGIPYAVGVEHTIFYCMFSVQLVETL